MQHGEQCETKFMECRPRPHSDSVVEGKRKPTNLKIKSRTLQILSKKQSLYYLCGKARISDSNISEDIVQIFPFYAKNSKLGASQK